MKHVELWPDETSNGRMDSPWIVSVETDEASTTKHIEYDYEVAKQLALDLGARLVLDVIASNRLGEKKCIYSVQESR